ncbi:hypothetical protein EVG20_g10949 [Dentipellis fragilis]|uniref:Uncharacterized protein n=1 Tax=Dentipellis fragilis TaxID=205917 RepID=A0A4Y9XQB7_9AGAM|nr:hypothetical protein EVG20_g10949 [Dentipellis fragilis]
MTAQSHWQLGRRLEEPVAKLKEVDVNAITAPNWQHAALLSVTHMPTRNRSTCPCPATHTTHHAQARAHLCTQHPLSQRLASISISISVIKHKQEHKHSGQTSVVSNLNWVSVGTAKARQVVKRRNGTRNIETGAKEQAGR